MSSLQPILYISGAGLLIALLLCYCFVSVFRNSYPMGVTRLATAVGLFSLLAISDFFLSGCYEYRFDECNWMFLAFIPFYLILFFFKSREAIRVIQFAAVLTTAQALWTLANYGIAWHQSAASLSQASENFAHVNSQSSLFLIGAPLCMMLACSSRQLHFKLFYCMTAVLNIVALIFSGSIYCWLALCVGVGYLVLSGRSPLSKQRGLKIGFAALAVLLLIVGFTLTNFRSGSMTKDRAVSLPALVSIWKKNIAITAHNPIIGQGMNTSQYQQEAESTSRYRSDNSPDTEPKPLYLSLLIDFGLIGLGLFLLVCVQYLRLHHQLGKADKLSDETQSIATGIHAGLLSILVLGIFETPILMQNQLTINILVSALLGSVAALGREGLPAPVNPTGILLMLKTRWRSVVVVCFTLGTLCVLLVAIPTLMLVKSAQPRVDDKIRRIKSENSIDRQVKSNQTMKNAIVSAEDGGYYIHHGIEWQAMHRALRVDMRSLKFVQGGSTITMQMARYLFLGENKTAPRKLAEIYLAMYIERRLSKDQILELYLNNAYFGLHAPGVERAAKAFFNKTPDQLTLGESAFLAGTLSKPPEKPEEVTTEYVKMRRDPVLDRMNAYFPSNYSEQVVERAKQERLSFAWEKRRTGLEKQKR